MNRLSLFLIFISIFIFFILQSSASEPAPCDVYGHVYQLNSTSLVEDAQIAIRNMRTGDILNTSTSASGLWKVCLIDMPNGYQNGDSLQVNATFIFSFNTTTIVIEVDAEGGCFHEVNLWLDTLPPFFTNHSPTISNTTSPLIKVDIMDTGVGVDTTTIRVKVQNQDKTDTCNFIPISGGYRTECLPGSYQDGNVSVSVSARDNLNYENSTSWSFQIDSTPPSCSDFSPLGNISEMYPEVKLKIEDGGIGVEKKSISIKVDGSNITPNCNFSLTQKGYNLSCKSELDDGKINVSSNFSDKLGNEGFCSWSFFVDTLPPFTANQSPTGEIGERSPTISIDIKDNGTGVDKESIKMKVKGRNVTPSISPIQNGFHVSYKEEFLRGETVSVQINASDYAGNEMGYSWSFSIRRGRGPTPTPTPAPLVATPEPLPANISIIIKKNVGPMKAGESKVVYFERSDIWEIEVKVRNAVSGFSLLIKQFIKKPDVPDPSGVPYRYLSIEAENITEEDIANATIRFKVNLSWIEENGIDKRTILLQRYDEVEKKWTPLPTEKIGEENRSLLYEALSPGFSIFTITGNIKVEVTPKEALPSPTIAETPTLLPPLGPLIVIPFLPPEVITAKPNLIALFLLIAGTLLALFFLYRIWK